jgi:hypothetical protein
MSRLKYALALAAVASLAFASVALAAMTKVTGGTTTVTASSAAATVLANNHITVTPVAPATASGTTFTFPITGGRINVKNFHGIIRHSGGMTLTNGTKSVTLRNLTVTSDSMGTWLWAAVRNRTQTICGHFGPHHVQRCITVTHSYFARVARVTNGKVSGGKATGTLKLTTLSASFINRLAGKKVAHTGDVLGTGTVAPTVA